jgi:N-sulfoglucosamine sulfohydrolase
MQFPTRLPLVALLGVTPGLLWLAACETTETARPPNIVILMSDNHSWNHLGSYGDPAVRTPTIDRVAGEGIRFTNAFASSPSCTPARASMLTGQDMWRLEEGANLWGTLPARFPVYPDMLEDAGYLVGYAGKGWGPGDYEAGGRSRNPAGNHYGTFEEFYNERNGAQPFCYWFSSRDPHRPYRRDGGEKAGIDLSKIVVPPYLPDEPAVRGDMADYYAEIEHFDGEVSGHLGLLSEMGVLDDTIVIIGSDNGWQMPRGLANLYDVGTRIPLIVSAPGRFPGSRVVEDIVSLTDLAPTILELAGLPVPSDMTARSLVPILISSASGIVDPDRDFTVMGRERHAFVRAKGLGYPGRAIRTRGFLYIRNYEPDRWPAGDPPLFGDVDAHMLQYPSPTKMELLTRREDEAVRALFDLAFAKRPSEELYDLEKDPYQMRNVAADPEYQERRDQLSAQLTAYLRDTGDPRETGQTFDWDGADYFQERDKNPEPSQEAIQALGLEERYSYVDP